MQRVADTMSDKILLASGNSVCQLVKKRTSKQSEISRSTTVYIVLAERMKCVNRVSNLKQYNRHCQTAEKIDSANKFANEMTVFYSSEYH